MRGWPLWLSVAGFVALLLYLAYTAFMALARWRGWAWAWQPSYGRRWQLREIDPGLLSLATLAGFITWCGYGEKNVGFLIGAAFIGFALWGFIHNHDRPWRRPMRHYEPRRFFSNDPRARLCQHCGYDRRATPRDRCPECGK